MPLTFRPFLPFFPRGCLGLVGLAFFCFVCCFIFGLVPAICFGLFPKKRICKNPFLVEGLFGWLGPGVAFAVCHLRPWAGFRACSRRLPFAVGAYA